jgi:hypothetical protein
MDLKLIREFRSKLKFSLDTAVPGTEPGTPSAGHCAAVAYVFHNTFGGELHSVKIKNQSHWFNKIDDFFIDLTSDQFGLAEIVIWAGAIRDAYMQESKIRDVTELNEETLQRARLLAERSGIEIR